jgi:carbonic anhydrase
MVLVLLFDLSENTTTPVIQTLALEAHTIARPGTTMPSGPLDFSPLSHHLRTTSLVQYTGSLTTPPCLEGVTFVIAPTRLPVDVRSYNAIKRVLKYNARIIQQGPGTGNALSVACRSH